MHDIQHIPIYGTITLHGVQTFACKKFQRKCLTYYNFYYNSLQIDVLVYAAFWWVGVILLSINPTTVSARTICPLYPCMASTSGYMICPSSASTQLNPPCNCCYAPKGCTIYYASGTSMCMATWKDQWTCDVKHVC
jgi:hypothetical protein